MQDAVKSAVLKLFPELSGGLHLDRYARVVALADQPGEGVTCERFRPRYAVDIEILTPDMEPDENFPTYTAVPLPVATGAGQECGTFAFPEPGALVVVGFAYGRPDHPIIRQIYPMGVSLPAVAPKEILLQQSPTVMQRADASGNWTRRTDAAIEDDSMTRLVKAVESVRELAREIVRISEHSTIEVEGMRTVEVGTVLTMLAGLRADLGTLGALNLTAGGDSTHTTAGNATETVGGDQACTVKGGQSVTVGAGRSLVVSGEKTTTVTGGDTESVGGSKSEEVGGSSTEEVEGDKSITAGDILFAARGTFTCTAANGGVNLFGEILAALQDIRDALAILAGHTHPDTLVIEQGGAVSAEVTSLDGHLGNIGSATS